MPAPTTLGPTDVSIFGRSESVQRTFQRKAFFAERRHWVFYVNDGGMLVYDSSLIDSEAWDGPTDLTTAVSGAEFSVFVQESPPNSPSYVHFVLSYAGGSPIFYVRGTLASDGTIAWDAPDEVAPFDFGWQYEQLGITMGYDGNIYVVYTKVLVADVNQTTPYVCQSTTADGTWTTGLGYPLQITAVEDASWIPLVSPYWEEVMVVYAAANGSIYSRVLSGGVWGAQVDTGSNIGLGSEKISIVSETRIMGLNGSSGPVGASVNVAFQGADWDLYSIRYESGAWGAANTIEVIGAFREANPMLAILDQGDSDGDHMPGTLYCFWTPTTDIPIAEWVTYRLSRDQGDTWTNEQGGDQAEGMVDETGSGFEIQASGSAYSFSDPDYYGKFYIGLVYVVHRMPPALRHTGLVFEDPSVDGKLLGEVIVRNVAAVELGAGFDGQTSVDLFCMFNVMHALNLPGEFIVRHSATLNLFGEFFVTNKGSENLLGEFIIRRDGDVELKGEFFVNQGTVDLFAQFNIGQDSVNLKGEFIVQHEQDENLKGQFIVLHEGDENLRGIFDVRQPGAANLRGIFIVRHPGSVDLPCQFRIDKDFISKGLNVSVYRDLGVVG